MHGMAALSLMDLGLSRDQMTKGGGSKDSKKNSPRYAQTSYGTPRLKRRKKSR